MILPDPRSLVWTDDPLPALTTIPRDYMVMIWSDGYVGLAAPHGDDLNPVRWCDRSGFPLTMLLKIRVRADGSRITDNYLYPDDEWETIPFKWAVVFTGTPGLPHLQKTWTEVYGHHESGHPQVPL